MADTARAERARPARSGQREREREKLQRLIQSSEPRAGLMTDTRYGHCTEGERERERERQVRVCLSTICVMEPVVLCVSIRCAWSIEMCVASLESPEDTCVIIHADLLGNLKD